MAEKAVSLCGARFCLHGRDETTGLDCIGLAAQCLIAARFQCDIPNGYSIRGGSEQAIGAFMAETGFERFPPTAELCEGDIVLVRPSPVQWHFLIRAQNGFVHAHAGLGKVVFCPGEAPWPIVSIFRLAED
ncbi:peptidoglycan endopeptidase [Parasphingorhabdus sp.]|uniref:peptidoglycan endopeptidase n=1 Tax=Parasphingorhabdus sp. TaxID=2709688 RepID=UPI003A91F1A0